jgi:hypothetical protein
MLETWALKLNSLMMGNHLQQLLPVQEKIQQILEPDTWT